MRRTRRLVVGRRRRVHFFFGPTTTVVGLDNNKLSRTIYLSPELAEKLIREFLQRGAVEII